LQLIESAFLLGTLRRLARPVDLTPLTRIRSLAYFLPVIAELQQEPLPGWVSRLSTPQASAGRQGRSA
jgi:hypothetical protein